MMTDYKIRRIDKNGAEEWLAYSRGSWEQDLYNPAGLGLYLPNTDLAGVPVISTSGTAHKDINQYLDRFEVYREGQIVGAYYGMLKQLDTGEVEIVGLDAMSFHLGRRVMPVATPLKSNSVKLYDWRRWMLQDHTNYFFDSCDNLDNWDVDTSGSGSATATGGKIKLATTGTTGAVAISTTNFSTNVYKYCFFSCDVYGEFDAPSSGEVFSIGLAANASVLSPDYWLARLIFQRNGSTDHVDVVLDASWSGGNQTLSTKKFGWVKNMLYHVEMFVLTPETGNDCVVVATVNGQTVGAGTYTSSNRRTSGYLRFYLGNAAEALDVYLDKITLDRGYTALMNWGTHTDQNTTWNIAWTGETRLQALEKMRDMDGSASCAYRYTPVAWTTGTSRSGTPEPSTLDYRTLSTIGSDLSSVLSKDAGNLSVPEKSTDLRQLASAVITSYTQSETDNLAAGQTIDESVIQPQPICEVRKRNSTVESDYGHVIEHRAQTTSLATESAAVSFATWLLGRKSVPINTIKFKWRDWLKTSFKVGDRIQIEDDGTNLSGYSRIKSFKIDFNSQGGEELSEIDVSDYIPTEPMGSGNILRAIRQIFSKGKSLALRAKAR